ncbi:MAG TPA: hypothetical protein VKH82_17335 [Candidatus Binatia bacterium]|nr:hypothetical protein [Candidatus Binatia bacterium]
MRLRRLWCAQLGVPGESHDGRPVGVGCRLEYWRLCPDIQESEHYLGGQRDGEGQCHEPDQLGDEPFHAGPVGRRGPYTAATM